MAFRLASSAFRDGDLLPVRYTCDGKDVSPPLHWNDAPSEAQAFALVMDDPDAPRGTFTHWIVGDIPPSVSILDEGQAPGQTSVSGMNDFSRIGYGGACPPKGSAHRYRFRLYALDEVLGIKSGVTRPEFENAIKGHVLAVAKLDARYERH